VARPFGRDSPMPETNASRPGLRLADHVRACCVDGQVILLDLQRSKYIGFGAGQSNAWGALADAIEGWPAPPVRSEPAADPVDIDRYAAPLLAQGLLTRTPPSGAQRATLEEPTRSLNAEDVIRHPAVGCHRALRLLQGTTATSLQLRICSLAYIAYTVAARRAGAKELDSYGTQAVVQEAVAAYLKLRLYVFTAHDRCLHDSLTLLRFLAAERIFPKWVIGVKVRPFAAHSWIQSGDTVLNDQHEHVRHYRPILVV
jgi:hypothetical protein